MALFERKIPRLVLAGVASGVGKTTITVGIARALRARGLRVALFKCGPDYLDPTYHARAVGAPSQNVDGWMMGRDAVRETFARASADADIAIIEGVMGLFDGAGPTSEEGSTAEIAKWLDAPVVLVVDAGGMARSFAALVAGFRDFDPTVNVAGVIANRVGSRGHLDILRKALPRDTLLLGGLPRDATHGFPERHLGLHSADEKVLPEALLDYWGEQTAAWLQLDALVELAGRAPSLSIERAEAPKAPGRQCRLGVARDDAFHFYYTDNLRRLEACGAELVYFSPLRDTALPEVDGLYLGGGYPEVHAAALSGNHGMRAAVAAFARRGAPIYAECGGLMYLTQAIRTLDGTRHEMVGLLPTEAHMCAKLQALGYVEVETQTKTILGEPGARFRGHQFRYSELSPPLPAETVQHVFSLRRRRADGPTQEGYRMGNTVASYVHAHWASNGRVPAELVASCVRWRREQAP